MMIIETLARILSLFSLLCILWTQVRAPSGLMGGILWLPKLWAGAWAPPLTLAGILGALLGLISGDYLSMTAGLVGAGLGIHYTILVTRDHDHFSRAFGESWEGRIPENLQRRLGSKRYRFIQPAPPVIPGERDVDLGRSIGTDERLLCDIWTPPQGVSPTGLAVIYFHGGLWQACDKDFLTQPLFRRLAGQGHVVMDVAYSLAPAAELNRMLADVKQAILWMKTHAVEYHVDPGRIVLMGVSGGGHLALMAAYAPGHPAFLRLEPGAEMSVRGVVTLFGLTDLEAFFHEYGMSNPKQPEYSSQITDDLRPRLHDRTWLDRFITRSRVFPAFRYGNMPGGALALVDLLGGTLKEKPDNYRLASPITHVGSHCPPTMQILAEEDFIVAPSHGQRLHQALCADGVPSVYLVFPRSVHGFDQYFGVSRRIAPAAQSATYDIERFLALLV